MLDVFVKFFRKLTINLLVPEEEDPPDDGGGGGP